MIRHLIRFEAHGHEPYIARFYWIDVGRNLFGQFQLMVNYGRIGTPGQVRHFIFDDFKELSAKLQQTLKKRLTAERRIGCCYRLIATSLDRAHPLFVYLQPFLDSSQEFNS